MKVPSIWMATARSYQGLYRPVRSFLDRTERVVSVKVYCSLLGFTGDAIIDMYQSEEYFNHRSPLSTPVNHETFFNTDRLRMGVSRWVHFETLCTFSDLTQPYS